MRQGFASPVGISPPTAATSRTTLDWRVKMLTYEEVAELLEYRPDVGGSCLIRKIDSLSGNGKVQAHAGDRAGSLHRTGYWHVAVKGKYYKAHRLVWLLINKEWPSKCLDHINGDGADNRIENLRLASHAENNQNTPRIRQNTSGHVGVDFHQRTGKWRARISVAKQVTHLGLFDSKDDAIAAYLEAKTKLHTFSPVPK